MKALQTSQSGQAGGQAEHLTLLPDAKKKPKSPHSKTSIAYWKDYIDKPVSRGVTGANYRVRIRYAGSRSSFDLKTPDKESAARLARDIYETVTTLGWEAAFSEFKPGQRHKGNTSTHGSDAPSLGDSVGHLISAVTKFSDVRPQTLATYTRAFRHLVSEIEGLNLPKRYNGEPRKKWLALVDAVPLANITPDKVVAWRALQVKRHSSSVADRKSTINTVNSVIRNSKALFSKKLLPMLACKIELPSPLPFEGISRLSPGSSRYQSKINARAILESADLQLRKDDPQVYLALQLALKCGLRVGEIDHLLWSAIDFERQILRVQDSEYHQLKSDDSYGEIDISDDTITMLKEFKSRTTDIFVVQSEFPPTHNDVERLYRCRGVFKQLRTWLRMKGVTALKPIHEMRKEVGSIIASEHGIQAASAFLRHSSIQITSDYYVAKKKRITPTF